MRGVLGARSSEMMTWSGPINLVPRGAHERLLELTFSHTSKVATKTYSVKDDHGTNPLSCRCRVLVYDSSCGIYKESACINETFYSL